MRTIARIAVLAVGGVTLSGACTLDRAGLASSGTVGAGVGGGGPGATTSTGGAEGGFGPGAGGTGGDGGAAAEFIWTADEPESNGTYTLPPWLTFVSPSEGKTSVTGPSSLRSGFGVDAPRARNTSSPPVWGLSVEGARTNNALFTATMTEPPWDTTPATMTLEQQVPSPDVSKMANQWHSTGSQYVPHVAFPGRVFSVWARGTTGSAPVFAYFVSAGVAPISSTEWIRYVRVAGTDASLPLISADTREWGAANPAISEPTSVAVWGAQVEPSALYPSSYIPTTDAPRTREAERLFINTPAAIFPNGHFDVTLLLAPHYASNELFPGSEHDLIHFDAGNRTFVRRRLDDATEVCQTVSSDELCTMELTWSSETALRVTTRHLESGRELEVKIGDEPVVSVSGGPVAPISVGEAVDLLGNGAPGAQEGADLRSIAIVPTR